ncbi:MAG: hypothetical protein K2X48_19375 [Chitinophagaceae bacterium]|nr:hypothetical protein [Chitinophagaceae bacterium]
MHADIKTYYTNLKQKILPDFYIGSGTIIFLTGIVFLFGLTIWWLNHNSSLQYIWEPFAFDKKIPASFCEKISTSSPVRQPINTFSNIVYLIAAIVILKQTWNDKYKGNTHGLHTAYCFLFGFILFYVFFSSIFYHASLINIAHKFDYSAVFSFSLFPVMFFLHRQWLSRNNILLSTKKLKSFILFFSAFLTVNLLLTFLMPKGKESIAALVIIFIFLALIFATVITEPGSPGKHYLILSVISILIALLWFEFDKNKILCNTDSYFQPHSLWNLFIGFSAFYFYLYMRSEHQSAASINNDIIKYAT